MLSLLPVRSFADEWHQGVWRARDLPDALHAEVLWERGGRKILGYALTHPDGRFIVLNDRIRATDLEWPILLHEASHIIQRHLFGFSHNDRLRWWGERDADYGSALLAIPAESAIRFVERRANVQELADYYEVPRALVCIRGALAVVLGEAQGDMSKARATLTMSRRSLHSWMATVARSI